MAGKPTEEEPELSPAELRMLESWDEVRGYSPRVRVAEPAQPPAGAASASPGGKLLDVPQSDGEDDKPESPPAD